MTESWFMDVVHGCGSVMNNVSCSKKVIHICVQFEEKEGKNEEKEKCQTLMAQQVHTRIVICT